MNDASHRDVLNAASAPARSADPKRRRFLLAFGASAAGAASASALASAPAVAAQAADDKPAGSGYRETEHVQSYYATTRI